MQYGNVRAGVGLKHAECTIAVHVLLQCARGYLHSCLKGQYNVPMKLDKISEILSEPDIIKDRKLSGKKVRENGEKKTIYS
jgi:hypothetical protein